MESPVEYALFSMLLYAATAVLTWCVSTIVLLRRRIAVLEDKMGKGK